MLHRRLFRDTRGIFIAAALFALILPDKLRSQNGVVINEIMYAPKSPEPEWIELFNTDSIAIDLTNWEIATASKSGVLPDITIAAGGYLVITKDSLELITLRPGNYAPSSAMELSQIALPDLDNIGSEVILRNAALQTIDSLAYLPSWGGSTGSSLERRNALTSATVVSNWGTSKAATGATPGVRNSLAGPDSTPVIIARHPLDIVLNEVMFAPVSPEPEWIELLNTTLDTINIAGWILSVQGHPSVTIPATNTVVPPDSLIVISGNDTELAAIRKVDIQRIVRINLPDLSNSGSTLALHDPAGNFIDSSYYEGNWIKADGFSIERIDPYVIGYESSNWSTCKDTSGSTILRPNSVRIRNYDLAVTDVSVSDTSATVTIVNMGLDTIHRTEVGLQIGLASSVSSPAMQVQFTPVIQQLSPGLASRDSMRVFFDVPQNLYGLFPATAYILDSLDENPLNDTLRFSIAPLIPEDSLVINEIMFDPQPNGCEWIELYNLSDKWISMDSTRLLTGESRPGEYTHVIPPLLIAPDSFGIVTANDSIYSIYPALAGRNSIASVGASSLDLGKDSSSVVFQALDSSTIDSVLYLKTWQQSILKKTFVGISLERKNPRGGSNDPQNWQASLDSATPLAQNSVDTSSTATTPPLGTLFTASFSPNPFSPDGDGFQDLSILTVQTGNSSQWAMQVQIFDAGGRMVRSLVNAVSVYQTATVTFDGKRDNGQPLPLGLYTALIQLTSASSAMKSSSSAMNASPEQSMRQETGIAIAGKRAH